MSSKSWIVIFILLALVCVAPVFFIKRPQIVINMPADAMALAKLDDRQKAVAGDRAVLWYTVWKTMFDKGYNSDAVWAANTAVDKVYGPKP